MRVAAAAAAGVLAIACTCTGTPASTAWRGKVHHGADAAPDAAQKTHAETRGASAHMGESGTGRARRRLVASRSAETASEARSRRLFAVQGTGRTSRAARELVSRTDGCLLRALLGFRQTNNSIRE